MTVIELEKSKLDQLAAEFRAKGYTVMTNPSKEQLPPFLRAFHPDLIAASPGENVVVEVKSPTELRSDEFVRLAEAIDREAGWRLQLAVVDLPAVQEIPDEGEIAGAPQVSKFLEDAQGLFREKRYEAAAILTWAAVEAILRQHALGLGVDAERKGSAFILKHLYTAGALDAQQYETFERMLRLRNALVHGFAARVDASEVRQLIEEAETLRSQSAA